MRIQTWGRVIGLTYTSYPRSLPWKIRSPRGNKRPPVKDVECNPLDDHPLPSLDHMGSHSTISKIRSRKSTQRPDIHSLVFMSIKST